MLEPYTSVPLLFDADTLQQLADGGVRALDAFLTRERAWLRAEYRRTGNPRLIALAGLSVLRAVKDFPSCRLSLGYARLCSLVASMLIASASSIADIRQASEQLDKALSVISELDLSKSSPREAYVGAVLLAGVARKAVGQFDEAISFLRRSKAQLLRAGSTSVVEMVPLVRQEVIMQQDDAGHRMLASQALLYRNTHPLEYYGSVKRVFEYVLNRGRLREAEQLYPEMRRSYLRVSRRVDPVGQVSFLKNIGQLEIERGNVERASRILGRAHIHAQQTMLWGQARQIQYMLDRIVNAIQGGRLITFRIE